MPSGREEDMTIDQPVELFGFGLGEFDLAPPAGHAAMHFECMHALSVLMKV